MKKIVLIICLLILMAGVATAAPLTDYSLGNAQVDFGLGYDFGSVNDPYNSLALNNSPTLAFGNGMVANAAMTVGLGNELAVRLRIYNSDSFASADGNGYLVVDSVTMPMLEIVWQCVPLERSPVALSFSAGFEAPWLSGAAGKAQSFGPNYAPTLTMGAQVVAPIEEDVRFFANFDCGLKAMIAAAGVSYAVSKVTDVNLGINAINYFPVFKDEAAAKATRNITSIAPYCSLSYKFAL